MVIRTFRLVDEPKCEPHGLIAYRVIELFEIRRLIIDKGKQSECYEIEHIILGLDAQECGVWDGTDLLSLEYAVKLGYLVELLLFQLANDGVHLLMVDFIVHLS